MLYTVIQQKTYLNPRNILELRGLFGSRPVYYPDAKSDFTKKAVLKYWKEESIDVRQLCWSCHRLVFSLGTHYPICEEIEREVDLEYLTVHYINTRPIWLSLYFEYSDFRRWFRKLRRTKQGKQNKKLRLKKEASELRTFLEKRRGNHSIPCDIRQVYREAKQYKIEREKLWEFIRLKEKELLKSQRELGVDPDPNWN